MTDPTTLDQCAKVLWLAALSRATEPAGEPAARRYVVVDEASRLLNWGTDRRSLERHPGAHTIRHIDADGNVVDITTVRPAYAEYSGD